MVPINGEGIQCSELPSLTARSVSAEGFQSPNEWIASLTQDKT